MLYPDKYPSVTALARHKTEGVDYAVDVQAVPESGVAVVAPHAGFIDIYSGDIASGIAGNDLNLYKFRGIAPEKNLEELHVTSIHFDEPRCLALLSNMDVTVTVHGCKGDEPAVYLSGVDKKLQGVLKEAFNRAGIRAETEGHAYTTGDMPANICNKNRRGAGVQMEFTRALRMNGKLRRRAAQVVRESLKSFSP